MAAENGTKQNGTQTELLSLPSIEKPSLKKAVRDTLLDEATIPGVKQVGENDEEEESPLVDESKLPPVVAKDTTT